MNTEQTSHTHEQCVAKPLQRSQHVITLIHMSMKSRHHYKLSNLKMTCLRYETFEGCILKIGIFIFKLNSDDDMRIIRQNI